MTTTEPQQEELVDTSFVRFVGPGGIVPGELPALDDEKVYIVRATCTGHHKDRRKDGELRLVAAMTVDAVWERGKQPIVDEKQMTFAEAMAAENGDDGPAFSDEDGDG